MKVKSRSFLYLILGIGLLIVYAATLALGLLREHVIEFEILFFAASILYLAATLQALRTETISDRALLAFFVIAALTQSILLFNRPTLSDDMYRYIWDGRVQAHGISPYRYAPDAAELAPLRDNQVWRYINRRDAVTIYPPAAEMSYALLWRIWPDNVTWFQVIMALGGLTAGGLLLGILHTLNRSPARVLIYLWSPLLAFETAHSAHVDGLILPLLVGTWWARAHERDTWVGILLGLATAFKFYPAVLFPALWRPTHPQGRWRMPLAYVMTVIVCYVPYVLISGSQVLGYLPTYFNEHFNIGPLVRLLLSWIASLDANPRSGIVILTLTTLAISGLAMILSPASNAEAALRRCLWPIGILTILSQNLFPWYMLWALPLIALFLQPGRLGLAANAWTAWWLFCILIGLSYLFFIQWEPVPWSIYTQYLPLYGLLLYTALHFVQARLLPRLSPELS